MLELVPVADAIGIEARGIDVTAHLSDDVVERLYEAWVDRCILLIRGQRMTAEQQIGFSRRFGEVVSYTRTQFKEDSQPAILVLSNITRNGKPIGSAVSGRVWHTDGHYLTTLPAGSMLHAIEVPATGGDTWFANMFAAYEALPQSLKARIEGLKVVISRVQSRPYNYPDRPPPTPEERASWTDVAHPLVRVHEINGRKALLAGGNVPWRIIDMPLEQGAPLITFLQEFAVQPRFTYRHQWRPGDIILWDNRSTMHKATYYDPSQRRLMHRTSVASRLPSTPGVDLGAHAA